MTDIICSELTRIIPYVGFVKLLAKIGVAAKAILAQDEKQSLGFNDSHIKSFTDEHALVEWDGGSQCYTYQLVKAPFYKY
jgi:hypothetical protein